MAKKSKAIRITEEIDRLYDELEKYQEKCKHKSGTKLYTADTGNWCKQDDSHTVRFECDICLKIWTVDSDNPAYTDPENKFREIKK